MEAILNKAIHTNTHLDHCLRFSSTTCYTERISYLLESWRLVLTTILNPELSQNFCFSQYFSLPCYFSDTRSLISLISMCLTPFCSPFIIQQKNFKNPLIHANKNVKSNELNTYPIQLSCLASSFLKTEL